MQKIWTNLGAWLKARYFEKSTWAGFAAIAGLYGLDSVGMEFGRIAEVLTILAGMGLVVYPTTPKA